MSLFPPVLTLPVSDRHILHIECHGTRERSKPTFLFLHGGPGHWYNHSRHSKWFDLERVNLIAFDQRGCGLSVPSGVLEENDPEVLTEDVEKVLAALEVDSIGIVGGSWGATLALLYAQRYPERCSTIVLRGPWLCTDDSLNWIWGGWAGQLFPDQWEEFSEFGGEAENCLIAYNRLLFSPNDRTCREAAMHWLNWEETLCCFKDKPNLIKAPNEVHANLLTLARFENHFALHHCKQISMALDGVGSRIADIPGFIVQGRFDFLCPVRTAKALAKRWPSSELQIVIGGHKGDHNPMVTALRKAIQKAAHCSRK